MPDEHVSENSKASGEANPMAEAPAEPTDAQAEQAAKQEKKPDDDG